ncbi:MAG TPA: hypothetical protein VF627_13085, partial [Abditibacterium sp.]
TNASFFAQQLDVISLNPLTLNVRGYSGGGGPSAEPKAGQTRSEALAASLLSDEVPGIGVYVPHRSQIDPQTGKRKWSTTLVLAETRNLTFTRSVPIAPLAVGDFQIGQRISFGVTPRPDGKMTAEVVRLIVEQPQSPKK